MIFIMKDHRENFAQMNNFPCSILQGVKDNDTITFLSFLPAVSHCVSQPLSESTCNDPFVVTHCYVVHFLLHKKDNCKNCDEGQPKNKFTHYPYIDSERIP